jgi:hypothetical protein
MLGGMRVSNVSLTWTSPVDSTSMATTASSSKFSKYDGLDPYSVLR